MGYVQVFKGGGGGEVEEKERFWNNLDRVVGRVVNGYRLYVP